MKNRTITGSNMQHGRNLGPRHLLGIASSILLMIGLAQGCSSTGSVASTQTTDAESSKTVRSTETSVVRDSKTIDAVEMYPDSSLKDWKANADAIIVGTVVKVGDLEPAESGADPQVFRHSITVRVDKTLWTKGQQVPGTLKLSGGLTKKDDETGKLEDLVVRGSFRTQLGDQFVAAIILKPGLGVDGSSMTESSLIHVTDGKLDPVEHAPSYQDALKGITIEALNTKLAALGSSN